MSRVHRAIGWPRVSLTGPARNGPGRSGFGRRRSTRRGVVARPRRNCRGRGRGRPLGRSWRIGYRRGTRAESAARNLLCPRRTHWRVSRKRNRRHGGPSVLAVPVSDASPAAVHFGQVALCVGASRDELGARTTKLTLCQRYHFPPKVNCVRRACRRTQRNCQRHRQTTRLDSSRAARTPTRRPTMVLARLLRSRWFAHPIPPAIGRRFACTLVGASASTQCVARCSTDSSKSRPRSATIRRRLVSRSSGSQRFGFFCVSFASAAAVAGAATCAAAVRGPPSHFASGKS